MGAFWAFPGKFPREVASARPQQSSSCKAALLLTNITAEYDAVFTLFLNWPKRELEPFILNPSVVAVTGLFAGEIMPFIHPLIWPRYATIWTLYIESESHFGWKRPLRSSPTIYSHLSMREGHACIHPPDKQPVHIASMVIIQVFSYFHVSPPIQQIWDCSSCPNEARVRVSPEHPKQHLAFPFPSALSILGLQGFIGLKSN